MYTCSSQFRDAGRTKEIGATVNAACQGNLSAYHFGHAWHRFYTDGPYKMWHPFTKLSRPCDLATGVYASPPPSINYGQNATTDGATNISHFCAMQPVMDAR
jgi:hypothetical protein